MPFFLGLVCYLFTAAALVGAGLFGLAVLLSPPAMPERVAGSKSAEPPVAASHPGEHRLSDTAQPGRDFHYRPKIDHAQGREAVNNSRQALEDARSAMAQERTTPRKRVREHRQQEIMPPEAPTARFEYPPERPSGH